VQAPRWGGATLFSMSLPFKLISTDFDGTLHAEFETPPVPEDLQELIGDLQRQGAKWVINTGRDLSSLMEGMARARLTIRPDYAVTVEREIYFHDDSKYVSSEDWNRRCKLQHQELFTRVRVDIPHLYEWVRARFQATVYEDPYSPFCLVAANNQDADLIQQFLEAYCQDVPDLTVVRNDIYARFCHVAYNKGSALGEIARQLGVPREEVFAAGDHLNDLPMLSADYSRFVVAPDNAVDLVKEIVRLRNGYVSHQPWGHGVARGLEFYLEGTDSGQEGLSNSSGK
jgi:HAD superfamily hydrolase (TIGR01484 family)